MFKKTTTFTAGTFNHACYRIPALVLTSKGTLVAFCEARERGCGDWTHGAIMARRCPDPFLAFDSWERPFVVKESVRLVKPRNWSEMLEAGRFADLMGWDQEASGFEPKIDVCTNNPAPIVDEDGKTIHLVYCEHYDRAYYTKSLDDGVTWSGSVDITPALEYMRKYYDWIVIASGPGHGLQLVRGKHAGRLIVPFWFASNKEDPGTHQPSQVGVIYSDDKGHSWHAGEFVPFTINSPNESQLVELDDGTVLMYSRNLQPLDTSRQVRRKAFSTSKDGAREWTDYKFDDVLPEPICLGALHKMHGGTKDGVSMLIYTVCDSVEDHGPPWAERKNLTVFLRKENERTWSTKRCIEPGPSAYSDLAVDEQNGRIYCLFEDGSVPGNLGLYNGISIACCDLAWILQGKSF